MQTLTETPRVAFAAFAVATVVFSSAFSILRLHRRFGRKTRYALKIKYTRWALTGYAVLSGVFSLLLSLVTPAKYGDVAITIPGAILLAFSSSVIVSLAIGVVGAKSKDQKSLITVANWVYETIDPEIDRLVDQAIVDMVLRISMLPRAHQILCRVGRAWVTTRTQFKKPVRGRLLGQIEEFSSAGSEDVVLIRFVAFLLNDCECDLEWIEGKVDEVEVVSQSLASDQH